MEGVVQRQRIKEDHADRQRAEARGDSPAVADRRREIERNQQAARQDLLDEVNREAAGPTAT